MPLSASMTRASVGSHPNSEKYRDSGFHPATGGSGSAVVSTRALVDKSGTTDVEITTGTFDAGPAAGTLASVQVKVFTPSGKLARVDNHNGLSSGATASFPSSALPHGTRLQVQTLVRSSDGLRTDVVSLADAVYFRPDLVASRLNAPAEAPLGAAVNLQAFIHEGNGEVGARADCVLYVDGAAADRANGIWVDAAGTVACAMTHMFAEARTYALELRVENVRPRDFDDTNNGVSSSINIVGSDLAAFGFAAQSGVEDAWWRAVSTLLTSEGIEETWDQTYRVQGPLQYASAGALIPRTLAFPIALRGEMSTNGGTVNVMEQTYATGEWIDWQQGYCASSSEYATGSATYVCAYTGGYLAGYTFVQYDAGGAEVRYHTESYVTYWDPSGQLHDRWRFEDYTDSRPMATWGPDFSVWLSVQGADDSSPRIGQATVQLEPFDWTFDLSSGDCSTLPGSPDCHEFHSHTTGVQGYVSYGAWPPYPE
jgi:hypothetical protein